MNMQKLMRNAWGIAKHAKNVFGGKASQYIAEAMKQAWNEAKAKAAEDAKAHAEFMAEVAADEANRKARFNNRDCNGVMVTFVRAEQWEDTPYGMKFVYEFEDAEGNWLNWITLSTGYTARRFQDGQQYSISFNKSFVDNTDAQRINTVTINK